MPTTTPSRSLITALIAGVALAAAAPAAMAQAPVSEEEAFRLGTEAYIDGSLKPPAVR
jgi:hypothetical protein